jgi:glyoxylase-like metal-dependent hydrolase (beta-lactamase superfamily II)
VQAARDFDLITSHLAIWHTYDAAVKTELYSTCLASIAGIYLIDPIPLQKRALDGLIGSSRIAGIVVTNSNHHRAAARFAQRFPVPIFAHRETFADDERSWLTTVADGEEISDGLRVIGIEGAASGEIALHCARNGGTLIVGDALVNFEPYGFSFLPAKYCSDEKQMRHSLQKLLDYRAQRILFAHGTPILSSASERFRRLLDSNL